MTGKVNPNVVELIEIGNKIKGGKIIAGNDKSVRENLEDAIKDAKDRVSWRLFLAISYLFSYQNMKKEIGII